MTLHDFVAKFDETGKIYELENSDGIFYPYKFFPGANLWVKMSVFPATLRLGLKRGNWKIDRVE